MKTPRSIYASERNDDSGLWDITVGEMGGAQWRCTVPTHWVDAVINAYVTDGRRTDRFPWKLIPEEVKP